MTTRNHVDWYLDMEGGGVITHYTFRVETQQRGGWVGMRLIRIEDDRGITDYDPLVHTPDLSHYMSHLWKARWIWVVPTDNGYIVERYWLVRPFGGDNNLCLYR